MGIRIIASQNVRSLLLGEAAALITGSFIKEAKSLWILFKTIGGQVLIPAPDIFLLFSVHCAELASVLLSMLLRRYLINTIWCNTPQQILKRENESHVKHNMGKHPGAWTFPTAHRISATQLFTFEHFVNCLILYAL